MQITPLGFLLIPLGIVLFLAFPRALYNVTVFFLAFSATAVVNYEGGQSSDTRTLWASMFFGLLLIAREFPGLLGKRLRIYEESRLQVKALAFFFGVALLSLIMPFLVDGTYYVEDITLKDSYAIEGSFLHAGRAVYLIYMFVFTLVIAAKNSKWDQMLASMRVYVYSIIFVSLWGLLEFVFYLLDWPFPFFIFNNNIFDVDLTGSGRILDEFGFSFKRISSVTVEPSVLVQVLLLAMSVVGFFMLNRRSLISSRVDRFALIVMTAALVLAASTSGYLGFIFMAVVTVMMLIRQKKSIARYVVILFVLALGSAVALTSIAVVRDYVTLHIFSKMETSSGGGRLAGTLYAWNYFLDYPILGLGWGSVVTYDMILRLMANTGVVGFLAFVILIITVFRRMNMISRAGPQQALGSPALLTGGLTISFVTLLFLFTVSGFFYQYGHFLFFLGLAIAAPTSAEHYAQAHLGSALMAGRQTRLSGVPVP